MAQVKIARKSATDTFGKLAVELGDKAHKAWVADVWQPLGIKDRTATQRADANGKGGTRAAMLQVGAIGSDNVTLLAQAAAYVRNAYYGNTSLNTSGISFGWLAVSSNLATIASNATFSADSKGYWQLRIKPRQKSVASSATKAPRKPQTRTGADSRNGEVKVVRESDAAIAARNAALADIQAANAADAAAQE